MTHRKLCLKASRYLRRQGIFPFHRCQYVVCELERAGESPDAFGWSNSTTQLLEVKITRADFLSDKKKLWRQRENLGLGRYRSYFCPEGLIKPKELPAKWGLIYINERNEITEIVQPLMQEVDNMAELNLVASILRREDINPQIFSYKNYKNG